MKMTSRLLACICFLFVMGCNAPDQSSVTPDAQVPQTPMLTYQIVASVPHNVSYFTEGLEFYKGSVIESTGNYGESKLVQYDLPTGKVQKSVALDSTYFGEGATVLHDTIYQMTYKEEVVFLYSARDFKKIGQAKYTGEGWGLTNDGKQLIASNGSGNLYFYEPGTFKLLRVQGVTENGMPPININELEYINGYVYANQWQYNTVLKIDPSNGNVVAKLDLSDLVKRTNTDANNVLNGIAYDQATKKIYVTGKNWPVTYEVQFAH